MTTKVMNNQDIIDAATELNCEPALVKAVAQIESRGDGFLDSGRPKILFEGHWFSRLTKHEYDELFPTISYREWTKVHYRGGEREWNERMATAMALNRRAAIMSASWGKFQIMGFNYAVCGFSTVEDFYQAMLKSEREHLMAFVNMIKNSGMDDELREKNWEGFARLYNGRRYKENRYDTKLREAYEKFKSQ